MPDTFPFAWLVLCVGGAGLLALLANRLTVRVPVPAPLLVLAGAAVAENAIPALSPPPERIVERLVTVALICVLFDGGLKMGWRRFRSAAVPITVVGIAGTFLTAAAAAVFVHLVAGISWYLALLVATAIAPTDPAVVFSVLGQREIEGRSGALLEGESGANDPVGIALMASLVTAGGLSAGAVGHVAWEFAVQLVVGAATGVVGGRLALWFMRKLTLPSRALHPLRTLAWALVLFATATLAHGSGFLAVFVAGIVIGDEPAPFKREVERFHAALASLGEIAAFVVLGLTIDLSELTHADVWIPGLLLGVAVAAVIRPVLVGLCLIPVRLRRNERVFVLFAGLKGAVPILLGGYILTAGVHDAERLHGIVVVVVVFSVLVQGSLVPFMIDRLRLPTRPT